MGVLIKALVVVCLLSVCSALVQTGFVDLGSSDNYQVISGTSNQTQSANYVKFPKAHRSVPKVVESVLPLDSLQSKNLSYNNRVSDVSASDFQLKRIKTTFIKFISGLKFPLTGFDN